MVASGMTHQRVPDMNANIRGAARRIWKSPWLKTESTSPIPEFF
jgi:hypothetical protein